MTKIYTTNNTGGFYGSGIGGTDWQQAQRLEQIRYLQNAHQSVGIGAVGNGGGGIVKEEPPVFSREHSELIIKELAKVYRDHPLTDEEIDKGIEFRRRHLMNVISNQSRDEAISALQEADVNADVSNILSMALLLY